MGKRGGIRVIYFWVVSAEIVVLLAAYPKNEKENLSYADKKAIRRAVEGLKKETQLSPLAQNIVEGLNEAAAYFKGERKLTVKRFEIPDDINVKAVRATTHLSQSQFAAKFGFHARTLQDWECGRSRPEPPVRAYLRVIERAPRAVEEALFSR